MSRHSYGDDGAVEARLARLEATSHEVPTLEGRYLSTDAAVTALANQGKAFAEFQREQRAFNRWVRASLVRVQAMPLALVAYLAASSADAAPTATAGITLGALLVALGSPELAARLLARAPALAPSPSPSHPPPKDP